MDLFNGEPGHSFRPSALELPAIPTTAIRRRRRGRERFSLSLVVAALGLSTLVCDTPASSPVISTHPAPAHQVKQPPVENPDSFITPPGSTEITLTSEKPSSEWSPFAKLLFGKFSKEQLRDIKTKINQQYELFLKNHFGETTRYNATKLWENTVKQIVADPLLKIDKNLQDDWQKIIMMVVYIESGGNPLASSQDQAKGLAQIKEATAQGAAKRLGISRFDLKNPADNLRLATAELRRLFNVYGNDLSLTLAAYNLGEGKLIQAVKTYLLHETQPPPGLTQIEENFEKMGLDGQSPPATAYYIQKHHITYEDLVNSPAVTAAWKSSGLTTNDFSYPYRAYLGALNLFKENFDGVFPS